MALDRLRVKERVPSYNGRNRKVVSPPKSPVEPKPSTSQSWRRIGQRIAVLRGQGLAGHRTAGQSAPYCKGLFRV